MFAPVLKDSLYLLSSLVTTLERIQVDEGEYLTSKIKIAAAEEKMQSIVDERQIKELEVSRAPEIAPAQTITESDDWFVFLDVVPKETPYVPRGIAKTPLYRFSENGFLVSSIVSCYLC